MTSNDTPQLKSFVLTTETDIFMSESVIGTVYARDRMGSPFLGMRLYIVYTTVTRVRMWI